MSQSTAPRYEAPAAPATPGGHDELRRAVERYEQAQYARVEAGERLRALLGQSAEGAGGLARAAHAAAVLRSIREGSTDGPAPLQGRLYRERWEEERGLLGTLDDALRRHPAWPWISRVRGVGPALASRLLSRLDARRAATPSAFWAYCGLATVPAVEYGCELCGYRVTHPETRRVAGAHLRLGATSPCTGAMRRLAGPSDGVRGAQPKPMQGTRSPFDLHARTVCFLIGESFLRTGGPYAALYERERQRLVATRPGWNDTRRHLAALRKAEKLFLSHLWLVWREAVGLPLTRPHLEHPEQEIVGPWEMVDDEPSAAPPGDAPPAAPVRTALRSPAAHRPDEGARRFRSAARTSPA